MVNVHRFNTYTQVQEVKSFLELAFGKMTDKECIDILIKFRKQSKTTILSKNVLVRHDKDPNKKEIFQSLLGSYLWELDEENVLIFLQLPPEEGSERRYGDLLVLEFNRNVDYVSINYHNRKVREVPTKVNKSGYLKKTKGNRTVVYGGPRSGKVVIHKKIV